MTSRTKRRWTVLALALGLIAAAPYVFDTIADRHLSVDFGNKSPWVAGIKGHMGDNKNVRSVYLWAGYGIVEFKTLNGVWVPSVHAPDRIINVPHESITLRVACAVALAGVWLLVVCGRLLARRWMRSAAAQAPEAARG